MNESINVTDAELEIMKVIWRKSKVTAKEISEALEESIKWSPSTVKTLLGRLCSKGIISFNKKGKEYYYFSLVSKENYSIEESKSFLDKLFNGSLNLMLLNFVKNKKISKEEAEELRKILGEVEAEGER
ncbi:transcriptional regulator, BlaI/MecI/CopY family [Clostridiales bacterium oral taxon 876 str. F0540]|nr:transcriptional regulator, BlaI/MecI/CopY family [Clostridiales bacterium oral taxon 876 str. F0540]